MDAVVKSDAEALQREGALAAEARAKMEASLGETQASLAESQRLADELRRQAAAASAKAKADLDQHLADARARQEETAAAAARENALLEAQLQTAQSAADNARAQVEDRSNELEKAMVRDGLIARRSSSAFASSLVGSGDGRCIYVCAYDEMLLWLPICSLHLLFDRRKSPMPDVHRRIKTRPLRRLLPMHVQKALGRLPRRKRVLIKTGLQPICYGETSNRCEKKCRQAAAHGSRQLKRRTKSGFVSFDTQAGWREGGRKDGVVLLIGVVHCFIVGDVVDAFRIRCRVK